MQQESQYNWKLTIGLVTVLIGVGTWIMDLMGWIYPCPYCRTQRTAILLLGIILFFPFYRHWITKWFSLVIGVLGLVVAAMQHFNHIKKIFAGTFELGDTWYMHPYLLSGAALFIITGQLMLILDIKTSEP